LVVSGTDLYIGGIFGEAGGMPANKIARWDGHAWSALGSGMGGGFSIPRVYALAVSGTDLYVGGEFSTADGVPVNGITKWDGSSWSALGSGVTLGQPWTEVYALAADRAGHLVVGGYFTLAGTTFSPILAQANVWGLDFTWNAIPSPQAAGTPFPVTVTARNAAGEIRTDFTNAVNLSGYAPGLTATNITIGTGVNSWGYPLLHPLSRRAHPGDPPGH
jgi:hypothetical protein